MKKQLLLIISVFIGLILSSCNLSAPQFSLSVADAIEIALGSSGDVEVKIDRNEGFADAVDLVFISPTTKITGVFAPNPAIANSSILTISLDNDLAVGEYQLVARGEAGGQRSGLKFNIKATSAGTVSGYVVNKKGGEPVVGSTVSVENSLFTTTTDSNGYYSVRAPIGNAAVVFTKANYATARVEGLAVTKNNISNYNTIQLPAFDSFLPTTPPTVTLDITTAADELAFKIAASLAKKEINGFIFADISLGSQGGNSGYLNASANHKRLGLDTEGKAEGTLSTTGFTGKVAVYAVVYDLNNNRSEVIKYVDLATTAGETPATPSKFSATAITFGDVSVFGTLSIPSGLDADTIDAIFHATSIEEIKAQIANIQTEQQEITTLSDLDDAVRWVDLSFSYDEKAAKPDAFIIYRQIGTAGDFVEIARITPTKAVQKDGSFKYRDSNGIIEGLAHSYKVAAVNGTKTASTSAYSVTPLAPFYVEATSPANNSIDNSVVPGYEMSFKNSSDVNATLVIVLNRIHSSFTVPYQSPLFLVKGQDGPFNPFKGLKGIPHGVLKDDAGYFFGRPALAPFHAYDWQTVAMTLDVDADNNILAISVASDFFNVLSSFGLDFGAKDGPVNAFLTGDGTF